MAKFSSSSKILHNCGLLCLLGQAAALQVGGESTGISDGLESVVQKELKDISEVCEEFGRIRKEFSTAFEMIEEIIKSQGKILKNECPKEILKDVKAKPKFAKAKDQTIGYFKNDLLRVEEQREDIHQRMESIFRNEIRGIKTTLTAAQGKVEVVNANERRIREQIAKAEAVPEHQHQRQT